MLSTQTTGADRESARINARDAEKSEVIEKTNGLVAGTTGLEPATSDVTGRRSNQLNYVPALCRN